MNKNKTSQRLADNHRTNFLIIGSGIAGLNFALNAARKGHVTILTKKRVAESNTNYAQGGIAAVLDKTDSAEKHIADTLKAGSYHNKLSAVRFMVEHSREAITRLIELGVEFEKEHKKSYKDGASCTAAHCLTLTREGGHRSARIAYVGDYTGAEVERILVRRVREHPNIKIIENAFALDLITKSSTSATGKSATEVIGVYFTKDQKSRTASQKTDYILADMTVLATGGVGQLYKYTTNPEIATGDGIAMAIRASAKTKDLEFIQFHPTALAIHRKPLFLLSEALRGEGAKLINSKGEEFMRLYDKRGELASRDIVARAIYSELKNGQVYLKFKNATSTHLKTRFPKIYAELKKHYLDLAKDSIPVVPAVHYVCGGIETDLHGKTSLKRLYALGEAARTGVHGANRLASNSLLEAFVFSNQIPNKIAPLTKISKIKIPKFNSKFKVGPSPLDRSIQKQIKEIMWTSAGIVRTKEGLQEGLSQMSALKNNLNIKLDSNPQKFLTEFYKTLNMLDVGLAILKAAQKRKKSLGCHYLEI